MNHPDKSIDPMPDIISGKTHRAIVAVLTEERDAWKEVAKSAILLNVIAALLIAFIIISFVVTQ